MGNKTLTAGADIQNLQISMRMDQLDSQKSCAGALMTEGLRHTYGER